MNKIWISLALLSCLMFAACGGEGGGTESVENGSEETGKTDTPEPVAPKPVSPAVGTWEMDISAIVASIEKEMAENPSPQSAMMLEVVKTMQADMVIGEDGTFSVDMTMPNPMTGETKTENASGTWELDGDQLSLTATEEGGETKETPDTKVATITDGVITIPTGQAGPFDMVFKKK